MALTSAAANRKLGARIGPRRANLERGLWELQQKEAILKLLWLSSNTTSIPCVSQAIGDQQHLPYIRCCIGLYYMAVCVVIHYKCPGQGCRSERLKDLLLLSCPAVFICHGVIQAPQRLYSRDRPNMSDGHLRNDLHRKHAAAQIRRRVSTACSMSIRKSVQYSPSLYRILLRHGRIAITRLKSLALCITPLNLQMSP